MDPLRCLNDGWLVGWLIEYYDKYTEKNMPIFAGFVTAEVEYYSIIVSTEVKYIQ